MVTTAIAWAQDSQFTFDPNGNLFSQTAANLAAPQILGEPQRQIVQPGELASFFVVAADTRGLTYQWRFNGTNLDGALSDTLLLTNVSAADEGQYSVVLSNSSDSVTSAPAALMLDSDGDGLPDSWELTYFTNLDQTATGDFDGDGVDNILEFLDGTDPTQAASVRYRITLFNDGGTVVVVPDQTSYTNGQIVTLTAIGSEAAPFHAWTGDVVTRSNSIALTMTTNKTVFARFTPVRCQWTNTAGGDWSLASNWTPNLVPGSNDIALIDIAVTVTLNSNADVGDFAFGAAIGSPTFAGSGTLTIHGTGNWTAGTMTGGGRTVIGSGATLNILNPSTISINNRTLDNGGTVLWVNGGNWNFVGGVITNRPGAVFEVQNAGLWYLVSGSPSRFDNAGLFRKTVSAGTFVAGGSTRFNNYGEVDLQTGTLQLAGGGLNTGTITVPSGTALTLSGGTFSSSSGSSIAGAGNFTLSGGTANLAGLVNVSGTNSFNGGTANLTGDYTCTNNTLIISGGTANFNGTGTVAPMVVDLSAANGTLGGTDVVTVGSAMDWSGGTMTGGGRTLISAGATLDIASSGFVILNGRTLENAGTVLWTSGNFNCTGGVITNRPGALFEAQNDGALYLVIGAAPSRFDNAGTFRKSAAAGTTSIGGGISFHNYGITEIETGKLTLAGGGSNGGSMDVPAGTALTLSGGTFSSSAPSTLTGAGLFTVSGGTANLAGLVQVSGTNTFSGGTANLTGDYICTNNTLIISGATANFSGTGTVAPAVLNLSGALGTLGGSSVVTVMNEMNWTGGGMAGGGRTVIPSGAALSITNSGTIYINNRTLDNGGTVLWMSGGNWSFVGGVITNRPGAVFEVQNPALWYMVSGSPSRFDNAGIFRKSISVGTVSFGGNISFHNYGTAEIETGKLTLAGGGRNDGSVNVPTGTTLTLSGGTFSSSPNSSITGAGNLTVSGGTANLAGLVNVSGTNIFSAGTANLTGDYICTNNTVVISGGTANFNGTGTVAPAVMNLSSTAGTLGGSNLVTVGNVMNWTGGWMSGGGRTVIPPGGALNIANSSTIFIDNRIVDNGGTVLWTSGGNWSFVGGVITNRAGAVFEVQKPASWYMVSGSPSRIDNAGTLRESVSAGTVSVGGNISLNNFGTLDLQSGILAANGGYHSASNAILHCALAGTNAGTGYGQLKVAGAVTVTGDLSIDLTGGFLPAVNDAFTLVTAGARNGTFANFDYPSNLVTMQLTNTPTAVIARVSDVLAVPRPILFPPVLDGTNVALTWTAVSNTTYWLEYSPDLHSTNWQAVPGEVTSLTNTASKLDALTPSNRFYRVRVVP